MENRNKYISIIILILILNLAACSRDNNNETQAEPEESTWPEVIQNVTHKQITTNSTGWDFHGRWSNDGKKISFARYNQSTDELSLNIWDFENESVTEILKLYGDFSSTWSPDDSKIAIDARETPDDWSQIFIIDLETKERIAFTEKINAFRPTWSKDNSYIAYVSQGNIYYKATDGSSTTQIPGIRRATNPCWKFNNAELLYTIDGYNDDIASTNLEGTDIKDLASGNSGEAENWASWSPDGNYITYHLFISGISRIAIKNLLTNEVYILSNKNNSSFPGWSPDGKSILYSYNNNIWVSYINQIPVR